MTCILLCTHYLPQGADSQPGGAAVEINKCAEAFPSPQGASECKLAPTWGEESNTVTMDPPACTGQCV